MGDEPIRMKPPSHPNIAKVLDGGATPTGRLYFVMELVRGVRITEFCDEARLSTEARLRGNRGGRGETERRRESMTCRSVND